MIEARKESEEREREREKNKNEREGKATTTATMRIGFLSASLYYFFSAKAMNGDGSEGKQAGFPINVYVDRYKKGVSVSGTRWGPCLGKGFFQVAPLLYPFSPTEPSIASLSSLCCLKSGRCHIAGSPTFGPASWLLGSLLSLSPHLHPSRHTRTYTQRETQPACTCKHTQTHTQTCSNLVERGKSYRRCFHHRVGTVPSAFLLWSSCVSSVARVSS